MNAAPMVHLRIEQGDTDWFGFVGDEQVASFDYWQDDEGLVWLVGAEVKAAWQRQGIGRRMIAAAVDYYDEVYASRTGKSEDFKSETRYLTEEGAALVNACIRDGIMKPEWLRYPPELVRNEG